MGQYDVEELLRGTQKPMTAEEMQEALGITIRAIRTTLATMHKHDRIKRVILTADEVEKKGGRYSGRHYLWVLNDGLFGEEDKDGNTKN